MNIKGVAVTDRRQHPRSSARVSIGLAAGGNLAMAQARDLSLSGMFIETPVRVPPEGASVQLYILPPKASQSIQITGVVTRIAPNGIAVKFLPLEPDERASLARFLASLEPTEPEAREPSVVPEEFDGSSIERALQHESEERHEMLVMARMLHEMAMCALESGRPEQARPVLEQVIELAPNVSEFHKDLGDACYRTGDLERAVREFERALALESEGE